MTVRTLRGRLAAAMLAILLLTLGFPLVAGMLETPERSWRINREPFQDALVLALFAVPALALIWLVSFWSLRPLTRASQQARAVGPSDPTARISRDRLPAEIVPLVDAVNAALDRMAEAFAAERRFTENAAHELRTPLAVLGLRLQRARQSEMPPDWPAIEADLAQLNRLVGQMLDLARKENAGRDAARRPVNLSRVAREAAALVFPMAEARGRSLRVDVPDTMMVHGVPEDLREALSNLLENALLHGGGAIELQARATEDETILCVSDAGPGPPEALRSHAFERFHKGSHSEGSGLGLAIVQEVARAHGGRVAFAPGAPCRVELSLPKT